MLKDAARGQFNVVMAWSVDRLGRSLLDLINALQEMHAAKVDLFLHQQALDTTTPAGKAMFGMMDVFAEFERSMIVARVNAGLARAKVHGTKSGKAIGRPRTSRKALRGCGTLTATPRSSAWHRCRRHGSLLTAEQDVGCLVPSDVMLLMGVAFARWLG